jgi:hypothetical protein
MKIKILNKSMDYESFLTFVKGCIEDEIVYVEKGDQEFWLVVYRVYRSDEFITIEFKYIERYDGEEVEVTWLDVYLTDNKLNDLQGIQKNSSPCTEATKEYLCSSYLSIFFEDTIFNIKEPDIL